MANLEIDKPLYLRIPNELKARIMHQCERLSISQAGLTKQALVKFLEEEEQIEADNAYRKNLRR